MRLNDPLITSFVYEDKEYEINLSFDNVLDVFDVLDIPFLNPFTKAKKCLEYLIGVGGYEDHEVVELWNHIFEKHIKIEHKKPIEYDRKGNPMPVKDEDNKKFIDLEKDAEFIYSSFQQAYNINLFRKQGTLHWSEFQALLNGLPSNTIMQRIIQIRLYEPSKGETEEYKNSMIGLQKAYALEDEEVDE